MPTTEFTAMTPTPSLLAAQPARESGGTKLGDLVELCKPRVTTLVLATTAAGLWLAPGSVGVIRAVSIVIFTALLIGAANTLNCWIERDVDGLMLRTRMRPLPAGRTKPRVAFVWGAGLAAIGLAGLALVANMWTAVLGAIAIGSYVWVYTPLKRVSPWAVVVGAIPGALPPLMGWTAVTGRPSGAGWALFGIVFFWQIPHVLAISLHLADDYARGGIRVLPLVVGPARTRRHILVWTCVLVAFTLSLLPAGVGGAGYAIVATLAGVGFLAVTLRHPGPAGETPWGRRAFRYSLIYLPVVVAALLLDAN